MSGNVAEALSDTLHALKTLGIQVNHSPSRSESDEIFEEVKNEILAVGFEEIIHLPEATDPRTELTIALLNDAGTSLVKLHVVSMFLTEVGPQACMHIGVLQD